MLNAGDFKISKYVHVLHQIVNYYYLDTIDYVLFIS